MKIRVTLSANAGVSVEIGRSRVLVDALHESPVEEFSALTPERQRILWEHEAFRDPDAVICTHCHPDHYSRALAREAQAHWPGASFFLPERELPGQTAVGGPWFTAAAGKFSLRFFALPHEHEKYRDVPHYGVLLSAEGRSVLIPGDCALAAPALKEALAGLPPVDLALLNFPWITLPRGRRFVEEALHPAHLGIFHLPFPEDDRFGYRPAAQKAVPLLACPDVRLLDRFLQAEDF